MATTASISYFKRFKMEVGLDALPPVRLPAGFELARWRAGLLGAHAEALFACFRDEIDSVVFPSLGSREGCALLMTEIARRRNFVPEATWLLVGPDGPCGTVQALRERTGLGSIQNLGIAPGWRGRGLGEALLLAALHGFRHAGLGRAVLEVTAHNDCAVRLYRRVGFRCTKTLYKAVPDPRLGPVVSAGPAAGSLSP
jgi:GNAT superfamily N-acetyltransferase